MGVGGGNNRQPKILQKCGMKPLSLTNYEMYLAE